VMICEKDSSFQEEVSKHENLILMVMGRITYTGNIVVRDSKMITTAMNLDLDLVLGELHVVPPPMNSVYYFTGKVSNQ